MANKRYCKYSQCRKEFQPIKGRFNQQTCDEISCAMGYSREKKAAQELKKQEKAIVDTSPEAIQSRYEDAKIETTKDNVFEYLQQAVNKLVRAIDYGQNCISSSRPFGTYIVNAGHFFSVGANPALRFNLMNIYNQCKQDNDEFGGNGSVYGLGLVRVFGQEIKDEIDGLVAKYPYLGLTRIEAKEALKVARQILREMPEGRVYSTQERIELRRLYNEKLGIY